jgi:hypothetical protein
MKQSKKERAEAIWTNEAIPENKATSSRSTTGEDDESAKRISVLCARANQVQAGLWVHLFLENHSMR